MSEDDLFLGFVRTGSGPEPVDTASFRRSMANPAPHRKYTIEDFVRVEEYSNVRHEYLDSQIYAMAGGTPEHGTYAANIIGLLTAQLGQRPCRVQTSDVRIRVTATGLDTYSDVSVVCGQADRDTDARNAITNPTVLVCVFRRDPISVPTASDQRSESIRSGFRSSDHGRPGG